MTKKEAQPNRIAEPLIQLAFSIHGNPGVYALLVGSGLSSTAGILTGWKVTLDLVRRLATAQGESEQPDWAAWYREEFGKEPNYSELVAEIASTRAERRAILHEYIEPTSAEREEGRKLPTKAHRAIADLVHDGHVRVILTTNFDRLIENALRERGVEPTVIDSVDALQGAEPLTHSACHLVKLHGDYKDARIRNTDAELAEYPPEFDAHLDRILDEHGLVVCGWSGKWDEALYSAIMRNPSRRYSLNWAACGHLGDRGKKIMSHRNGHIIRIVDADDFLGTLRDRVETIAHTSRQDPRSVELLVESTKRFASGPEYRIQLHDLLASEVQRLLHPGESHTAATDSIDAEGMQLRCTLAESATEPLARMLGVIGRWGNDTERDIVANAFVSLWKQAGSGESLPIHMQRYPAVLLLSSYGIGLTLAKRWRVLHSLLLHSAINEYGDPKRIVDLLSDWFLEGYRTRVWNLLPALERHKTPAHERLFGVLDTWRNSFAPVITDFEELHNLWEILVALAYVETQVGAPHNPETLPFWAPVGRNGWRFRSRNRILKQIMAGELGHELIAAGFGRGKRESLIAAADSYSDFTNRTQRR